MRIRKLVTVTEEVLEGGGRTAARPVKKVAAIAVIANPFAGPPGSPHRPPCGRRGRRS